MITKSTPCQGWPSTALDISSAVSCKRPFPKNVRGSSRPFWNWTSTTSIPIVSAKATNSLGLPSR